MKITLKLDMKSKIYSYLISHSINNILTTGLIVLAAIGISSIGIANATNTLGTWFATDFTDIHVSFYADAFNQMMAQTLLGFLQTLLSIPLFLLAYLVSESHPYGIKLSIVTAFSLILLAFLTNYHFEVLLIGGALCCVAGLVQPINQQKTDRKIRPQVITENIAKFGLKLSSILVVIALFGIVIYIFARGAPNVSWDFIVGTWDWGHVISILNSTEGITANTSIGGILPYILGSLIIVVVCELIALPLGIGAAIYLSEYSSENRLTNAIRFFVETLAGVPSIVFGLLGLILFVKTFGWQESILAGGLSLAFMILPWNIRVTEEAMKSVPQSYREGSYALGATKWQTIRNIVLYASSPGIITGILLGVGAAIGETAVLIHTTGAQEATTLPGVIAGSSAARVPALSVWIWNVFTTFNVSKVPLWYTQNIALAGSVVLMVIFLAISLVALLLRNYMSKKITGV